MSCSLVKWLEVIKGWPFLFPDASFQEIVQPSMSRAPCAIILEEFCKMFADEGMSIHMAVSRAAVLHMDELELLQSGQHLVPFSISDSG
jgi:hypothetical protein